MKPYTFGDGNFPKTLYSKVLNEFAFPANSLGIEDNTIPLRPGSIMLPKNKYIHSEIAKIQVLDVITTKFAITVTKNEKIIGPNIARGLSYPPNNDFITTPPRMIPRIGLVMTIEANNISRFFWIIYF